KITAWCLDMNDLTVSKLAAGRLKDYEFVNAHGKPTRYLLTGRSEPAKRTIIAGEVQCVVGDDHEPGGQPGGQALVIAGFRAFGPRVVAGAKPVLRPYQIARQAEAIDQKMRQENYRHCPCGADEQERKAVRDHMAQGRPRASA